MIEFAVVLMIKRIVELHNNQTINAVRKAATTEKQNSCQVIMLEKINPRNGYRSNVGFDDDEDISTHSQNYAITDVVDFTALFLFFVSYVTFNCIYMVCYM
jgi:hypothetical protein